jgi:hypothetical protein
MGILQGFAAGRMTLPARGRDIALRCPRPRSSGRNPQTKERSCEHSFRRLTLRSATGTAQRASPYLGECSSQPLEHDHLFGPLTLAKEA